MTSDQRLTYSRSTLLQLRDDVTSAPSSKVKRKLWHWGILRTARSAIPSKHLQDIVNSPRLSHSTPRRFLRPKPHCPLALPPKHAESAPAPCNSKDPPKPKGNLKTPTANRIQTNHGNIHVQQSRSNPDMQFLGKRFKILQLNIEGISASKREILSHLCATHKIDVICLQEVHANQNTQESRLKLKNYDLIAFSGHPKYGRATYVHHDIADVEHLGSTAFCDSVRIGSYQIANVYKPPNDHWSPTSLPALQHPAVYVGDFNSHHLNWGYEHNDSNGKWLAEWSSNASLHLLTDLKQRRTFRSARWQKEYSPDLHWVSSHRGRALQANIEVLDDFPRSQHRPTITTIGLQIPIVQSIRKPRWNFRKANWEGFKTSLDRSTPCIPVNEISIEEAYTRFSRAIYKAAINNIPRGFRPSYIPCLDSECQKITPRVPNICKP
jgi:hypothetical protein